MFGLGLPRSDVRRFALGVTIPVDPSEWAVRKDGQPRDFVRGLSPTERLESAQTLGRVVDFARRTGVRVFENAASTHLRYLFEGAEVVTLIAHAPDQTSVELFDTAVGHDEVVRAIPDDFRGLVDLTLCRSDGLADRIRFERSVLVVGHRKRVRMNRGLMIYLNTLLEVIERGRPYEQALSALLDRWMEDPTRWA
jgi:hypothetical protein